MTERAQRIGADLDVVSTPGHGCSIILTLPASAHPMPSAKGIVSLLTPNSNIFLV